MRIKFEQCKTYATARRRNPWTNFITKVCGGFMCFESWSDFHTFKNQK